MTTTHDQVTQEPPHLIHVGDYVIRDGKPVRVTEWRHSPADGDGTPDEWVGWTVDPKRGDEGYVRGFSARTGALVPVLQPNDAAAHSLNNRKP